MTVQDPVQDADDLALGANLRSFVQSTAQTIDECVAEIETGRFDDASNVTRLIKDLNTARLELLKLENRIAQDLSHGAEKDGPHTIDFDDIRTSIGRQLDRIRDAKAAKKILEKAARQGRARA